MKSDEFVEAVLAAGRYSVDLAVGKVRNRRGSTLGAPLNQDGYPAVTLTLFPGLQKTVAVHRIVAIAAWGAAAVHGKQVAHRDHDKTNNAVGNLWLPSSVKEHNEYDGTGANLKAGQSKCKEFWLPCARCGDPNGPAYYGRITPARATGRRFGIEGKLCWHCYRALDERERRRRKREAS